jgi:hypothetical protein
MTAPKPKDTHAAESTTKPKVKAKGERVAGGAKVKTGKAESRRGYLKGTRRTRRAVTKSPGAS